MEINRKNWRNIISNSINKQLQNHIIYQQLNYFQSKLNNNKKSE